MSNLGSPPETSTAEHVDAAAWQVLAEERRDRLKGELSRPVLLPDVAPTGETLSQFFRRAVVENPDFAGPAASCKRAGYEVRIPMRFRPALLTTDLHNQVQEALQALQIDPAESPGRSFDSLWTGRMALGLKMALEPAAQRREQLALRPDLPLPAVEDEPDLPLDVQVRLDLTLLAVRRRDSLALQLYEALRTGSIRASGFAPSDPKRVMQDIAPGWWSDLSMECWWRENELQPQHAAAARTPYFRGLYLRAAPSTAVEQQPIAVYVQATNNGEAAQNRQRGRSFRGADQPLIEEMRDLREREPGKSVEYAARSVYRKAVGKGNDESKVKRLTKLYHQQFPGGSGE